MNFSVHLKEIKVSLIRLKFLVTELLLADLFFVAIIAVVDLNGRYFGGRVVKACFYNLDKFRVLDLAEQV